MEQCDWLIIRLLLANPNIFLTIRDDSSSAASEMQHLKNVRLLRYSNFNPNLFNTDSKGIESSVCNIHWGKDFKNSGFTKARWSVRNTEESTYGG